LARVSGVCGARAELMNKPGACRRRVGLQTLWQKSRAG